MASTEGPPAASAGVFGVSWPVPPSMVKAMILSSSCRQTYRACGIFSLPGLRSPARVSWASWNEDFPRNAQCPQHEQAVSLQRGGGGRPAAGDGRLLL